MPISERDILDYIAAHPGARREKIWRHAVPGASESTVWRIHKLLVERKMLEVSGKGPATG